MHVQIKTHGEATGEFQRRYIITEPNKEENMTRSIDKCYNRISKKILNYSQKYIKDDDNIMALEIDYMVYQELEKLKEQIQDNQAR